MNKLLLLLLALPLASCAARQGSNPATGGATASGNSTITASGAAVALSWNASAGSPSGYYVQQSIDGATYATVQTVTGTSATVSGLTRGQAYYFRVQAYNAGGASTDSNVFSVIP